MASGPTVNPFWRIPLPRTTTHTTTHSIACSYCYHRHSSPFVSLNLSVGLLSDPSGSLCLCRTFLSVFLFTFSFVYISGVPSLFILKGYCKNWGKVNGHQSKLSFSQLKMYIKLLVCNVKDKSYIMTIIHIFTKKENIILTEKCYISSTCLS